HGRHHLAEHVLLVRAAGALLEVLQLARQVPGPLAAQFGSVHRQVALAIGAVAGSAHGIGGLSGRDVSGRAALRLGKGGLPGQPRRTSSLPLGSAGFMPKGLSSVTKRALTVPSFPSAPGSRYFQCHCCASASTSCASCGTWTMSAHTRRPGASMAATPPAVTTRSHHSSFLFSGW